MRCSVNDDDDGLERAARFSVALAVVQRKRLEDIKHLLTPGKETIMSSIKPLANVFRVSNRIRNCIIGTRKDRNG